ncbi:hypothetical protein ACIF8W_18060 [Streptomyces sp. NPDC085639]|uniref:hypothetical protein n=1 Tax=Streptomyces sp. NPDC085639 TaxID=3365734 RepID=UPI0037D7DBD7
MVAAADRERSADEIDGGQGQATNFAGLERVHGYEGYFEPAPRALDLVKGSLQAVAGQRGGEPDGGGQGEPCHWVVEDDSLLLERPEDAEQGVVHAAGWVAVAVA